MFKIVSIFLWRSISCCCCFACCLLSAKDLRSHFFRTVLCIRLHSIYYASHYLDCSVFSWFYSRTEWSSSRARFSFDSQFIFSGGGGSMNSDAYIDRCNCPCQKPCLVISTAWNRRHHLSSFRWEFTGFPFNYLLGPGGNGFITATAACCGANTAAEKKQERQSYYFISSQHPHWLTWTVHFKF